MDDFKPDYTFKEVNKDKPFRVWCQKVLPTIYDDSLSYYELLTKVVYILNETIERVNDLDDNVDELNKAFNQLVLFLNTYKQELDSRMDGFENRLNEQDSKIDSFVQNMEKYVETYVTKYVDENVTNIVNETFTEYVKTEEFTKIVEVAVESDPSIAGTKDDTEEILAKIGNTNDEGGSSETGSVMAKLNTIINTGGGGGGGGTGTGDAQESSVQKVISRVGVTDDTGATSDSGTVMGKLNDLITSNASQTTTLNTLATNTATNNTASVTGTLSQKLSYIANTLIGATGNTGGSATAGTAMAKLNAIVSNTITNNTANLTGTLSQKLSYIANTLIGATNATGGTTTAGTVNAKLNAILRASSSITASTVFSSTSNIKSIYTNYVAYGTLSTALEYAGKGRAFIKNIPHQSGTKYLEIVVDGVAIKWQNDTSVSQSITTYGYTQELVFDFNTSISFQTTSNDNQEPDLVSGITYTIVMFN